MDVRSDGRRWREGRQPPLEAKVTELLPDDKVRIENGADQASIFDASWNPRNPQRTEFWSLDFKFPLSVGAAWSFASPPGSFDTAGRSYYQHGQHKVVARETITVPAGTFDCFRLEGESHYVGSLDV